MPQGEVMWQLGDIHEKLGNHGKAGSVGFVSRPPWLEENHGLIGICLRSVDQFDPCNESSCCILVGVWPIRRNVSIDVTMYVYIYIYRSIHAKSSPRTSFAMLVAKGMRNIWHGPCVEREKRRENEPYSWHDFLGFFVFAFFFGAALEA